MKLIYLNIILFFCFLSCQKNVKKKTSNNNINVQTVIDTENQTQEIINAEGKMLEYLSSNFKKLADSTLIKKPKWMVDETTKDIYCGYIFNYAEGHTFKHEQECVEWGEIVTVEFKGHSIEEVHKIVIELYENVNYGWYNNKTEYRPKESYETVWTFRLKENEKGTELSFAYSWI